MKRPSPKQVDWLLVDLCEKAGFSMAIRDNERFHAVVMQGPDAFTDAVLAAEGLAPDKEKQMRRALNTFVSARFAQWETGSGAEQIAAHEPPLPFAMSDIQALRTLDLPPAPGSRGGR